MSTSASDKASFSNLSFLGRTVSTEDVWRFYKLAAAESDQAGYSGEQLKRLLDPVSGMGRIESKTEYFKDNYCRQVGDAVRRIFALSNRPRILDVCAGTGTQSILFALLGADVVSLDYHQGQLDTLRARVEFYAKNTGRSLSIAAETADVKSADFTRFGSFDAVYSHIGVGRLLTAEEIFDKIGSRIRAGGLLLLKNGNPDCFWLSAAGRTPADSSRARYRKAAARHGFEILATNGTAGLPRPLWSFGAASKLASRTLENFLPFQINIAYVFRKAGEGP